MYEILSVREASEKLDVSMNRVRQLIRAGRLPATKLGREYAIRARDLAEFRKIERPTGRPAHTHRRRG